MWISASEKLPEEYEPVLVWSKRSDYEIMHFENELDGVWVNEHDYVIHIDNTWWMPLPKEPKDSGAKVSAEVDVNYNRATKFFRDMQLAHSDDLRWGEFADAMDKVISTYIHVVRCKDCIYRETCIHTNYDDSDGEGFCKWGKSKECDGE